MIEFSPLSMTRLLVRKILENPHGHAWSIQGLGMLRLYLSPEVRLHIWNPVAPFKVANVSELHTHPWHFTSTVITGEIKNHIYYHGGPDDTAYHRGVIECGPSPTKKGAESRGVVKLRPSTCFYGAGGVYSQRAEEIHQSEPLAGTVTICSRRTLDDPDHAFVFWPLGEEWVSAEPRAATVAEIDAFARAALARMDSEALISQVLR